jgi:hypothetical protein
VYEICEADNKAFLDSIGADISISKICVRDASKVSECIRVLPLMLSAPTMLQLVLAYIAAFIC